MRKLSRGEFRLAVILILVITLLFLVLLAIMDISLFFLALIAVVVGIYFLRTRKPELFAVFEKEKHTPGYDPRVNDPFAPHPSVRTFSPRLILLYYSGVSTQQIPVNKTEFTIGRSNDCDFTLTGNTNISKKHCLIRYDENKGQSVLIDKQSTNGTKLNGQALTPGQPYTLHAGDMIQLDDRVLTVQLKNY